MADFSICFFLLLFWLIQWAKDVPSEFFPVRKAVKPAQLCRCTCVRVCTSRKFTTPIEFTWVYAVWSKRLNENSNGMEHTIPYCKAIKIMIYTHLERRQTERNIDELTELLAAAAMPLFHCCHSVCENLPKNRDQLVKSFISIEETEKNIFSQRVFSLVMKGVFWFLNDTLLRMHFGIVMERPHFFSLPKMVTKCMCVCRRHSPTHSFKRAPNWA